MATFDQYDGSWFKNIYPVSLTIKKRILKTYHDHTSFINLDYWVPNPFLNNVKKIRLRTNVAILIAKLYVIYIFFIPKILLKTSYKDGSSLEEINQGKRTFNNYINMDCFN